MMNATRRLGSIGVKKRQSNATIITIGKTETADSLIFSPKIANLFCGFILISPICEGLKMPGI